MHVIDPCLRSEHASIFSTYPGCLVPQQVYFSLVNNTDCTGQQMFYVTRVLCFKIFVFTMIKGTSHSL